ncbi:hypothetical protein [Candidatus Methanocrinis natronophilus]|uniref:Uncharacterized protein n=1 Tax=Candidatus Methanocrinis natronophilus TaxID=3033396 RepID=A0ABT5XA66_9EURY|nr:hypothetical protein [Candidatus Methanocrinis natronophilus]MDF0591581.1 hypothetical protein [Candidatus Methanocrinis natronophilus]
MPLRRKSADVIRSDYAKPRRKKLRLAWAVGLREFRDRYTSLELQEKSLGWWVD